VLDLVGEPGLTQQGKLREMLSCGECLCELVQVDSGRGNEVLFPERNELAAHNLGYSCHGSRVPDGFGAHMDYLCVRR
jgi:hypothetical protein